jgi:sugar diacid utilization regulator
MPDLLMEARCKTALLREKILLAGVEGGIEHIIKVASQVLEHPILLGDSILTILAWTGAAELSKLSWEGFIDAGCAPDFQADRSLFLMPKKQLAHGFEVCLVWNPLKEWTDLLVDIPYGQAAVHLVISGEGDPFCEEQYELLALLCKCISTELQRNPEHSKAGNYSAEHFLLQLIQNEKLDDKVVEFRANLAGLKMEASYILLLVDLRGYHPVCYSVATFRSIVDETTKGWSTVTDHILTVLVRSSRFTQQVQDSMTELMKQNHLQGVCGSRFYHLSDLFRSYQKTVGLLAMRSFGEEESLIPGEKLELFYLIDRFVKEEGYLPVDHPILHTLMESDRGGTTDYLETVYLFLRCGKKPVMTSKRLHIHKNTLAYRLRRIEELTGIDWDDGDLMFRLYFQLSAIRYGRINGMVY